MTNRWSMRAALAAMVLLGGLASGCARSQGRGSVDPGGPGSARTIIAEPGAYDDIYVADSTYVERTTTTTTTTTTDGTDVGYDTLSDGTRVEVVSYVHSYPEPIETFPRVYWGGQWYYNVNGDFVFYNATYGGWAYYWGPPAPLVSCWNGYYPWAPYYWGTGFYGAGWYWGGVGYYGYHAYGLPVVNQHHHHHGYWADGGNGGGGNGGGRTPSPGGPSTNPSKGGGYDGPARRTGNATGTVAHRDRPGARDGAPAGARADGGPQRGGAGPTRVAPGTKVDGPTRVATDGPTRVAPSNDGPTRVATGAPSAPTRTGATSIAPQRTVAVADGPTRSAPNRMGTPISSRDSQAAVRQQNPGRSSYTTSSGQRVTVIDPQRSMGVPSRSTRTIGSVPASSSPRPVASRDPFSSSSSARPSWNQPSAPSRGGSSFAAPSRSNQPSSFSAPSRSASPSRSSAPSRSSMPSFSAPSRSSSPSRSYSPPSRSSSSHSSSPSRSYSPPSRSSSSHSSPSRSFSPSRSSSGGGGHHSSPSRSSGGGGGGGGHHSAPSRHR